MSPNSKENTITIGIFEAKDYYPNLITMTSIFHDGIKGLKDMIWHNKKIKLYVFGDYAFLCSLYGLSGPAGTYPCVWCHCRKNDIQKPISDRDETPRTLSTIKQNYKQFKIKGCQKTYASECNNIIHNPLWPVAVSRVCPPYLHILLGVVKKHHDLLECACHDIDLLIAKEIAECEVDVPILNITLFEEYIKKMRQIRRLTQDIQKLKKEYAFEKKDKELNTKDKTALLEAIRNKIKTQEKLIDKLLVNATLDNISGPVTSNLDKVLQENNIKLQAFHSRSFTGNHCHKYLQTSTIISVTGSVITKTLSFTSTAHIIQKAQEVALKFKQLNLKYQKVHNAISHCLPIHKEEVDHLQNYVNTYLQEYRSQFPGKVFPKLHMLEDHAVQWIKKTGFGMALLGEQGN